MNSIYYNKHDQGMSNFFPSKFNFKWHWNNYCAYIMSKQMNKNKKNEIKLVPFYGGGKKLN